MEDKFLDSAEMEQLKNEIEMTRLGRMLYDDGMAEGEKRLLISKVKTKLAKGKSIEVIANEIEETVETVMNLIKEM